MKRKTLTERVAELERELAELKAAPKTEQHIHYHTYPQTPIPQPHRPHTPYPRPQWWYTTSAAPSAVTWQNNNVGRAA